MRSERTKRLSIEKLALVVAIAFGVIGWGLWGWDKYEDAKEARKNRELQMNDLARMEYKLCWELVDAEVLCPLLISTVGPVVGEGLSGQEVREVNDIYGQIRDYRVECKDMNPQSRREALTSFYVRSRRLRKDGVVVTAIRQEMAALPRPYQTYEKAADECYERYKMKYPSDPSSAER